MKFTTRILRYYQYITCCVVNFNARKVKFSFDIRLAWRRRQGQVSPGCLVRKRKLTGSDFKVVLQESTPPHIRQLILYHC
jgi:hypothetical protein